MDGFRRRFWNYCEMKTILSLFDYTGNWSKPYLENGYNVVRIDSKYNMYIEDFDFSMVKECYGILAPIPCTDFALSGARWFKQKGISGIENSMNIVSIVRKIINHYNPHFWCVENPMSRIHKLNPWLGEVKFKFNPCDFAGYGFENERYNKQTWLWGNFNNPIKKRLEPLQKDFPGFTNLGGKSERTKELRSITPLGFSYAFYYNNK